MKASLKLREGNQNPLVRAKVPISALGLPFVYSVVAGDPSDLSFHLRSASHAGPSLKLSYCPNDPSNNPFSFSVKSGVGLWGSPDRSPLVISAHFNLIGQLNPSFSLQIRPQIGDFSLKKTARSLPLPNPNANPSKENGDSGLDPPPSMYWTDIHQAGGDCFSGIALTARTLLPVMNHVRMNFRWGLNFPAELSRKNLPFLTVDKIRVFRQEQDKPLPTDGSSRVSQFKSAGDVGDLDLEALKGMCFWMGKEVEALQRENRWMKETMDDLKRWGIQTRNCRDIDTQSPAKGLPAMKGDSSEFEKWRKRKQNGGGDEGRRDAQSGGFSEASGNEVEEELKRAIKAASS